MFKSAGDHLTHFSWSIGTVDRLVIEELGEIIDRYFRRTLGVCFYQLALDGAKIESTAHPELRDQPGLTGVWSSHSTKDFPIRRGDTHRCHTTWAYDLDRPLWITADNGGLLSKTTGEGATTVCQNHWSPIAEEALPPYLDYADGKARTSIILPLRYAGRVFGVMNLEFPETLKCTELGRDEMMAIANALARILWLHETDKERLEKRRRLIERLSDGLRTATSLLSRPQVFVASAAKADEQVVDAIKATLKGIGNFDLVFWRDISESGNINSQVIDRISTCLFGVCYLSEPVGGKTRPRYRDNANVLFEAGMLNVLGDLPETRNTGWIPVRESHEEGLTAAPPFDIVSLRTVIVPRDARGKFNKQSFVEQLSGMIKEARGANWS